MKHKTAQFEKEAAQLARKNLYRGLGTKFIDKMTLVIGLKYKGGVMLIGDTKVMEGDYGEHYHENKIEIPVKDVKISIACAGLTDLAKEFNRKIDQRVDTRVAQYDLMNRKDLNGTGVSLEDVENGKVDWALPYNYGSEEFLDDCADLISEISERGRELLANPIEALVAVKGASAKIYHIIQNGFKREIKNYAIGSGAIHIEEYLNKNAKSKTLSFYDAILLGSFLIKYVEELGLDKAVGLKENELPQIFVLSKKNFGNYEFKEKPEKKKEILKEINKRIKEIKKNVTFS